MRDGVMQKEGRFIEYKQQYTKDVPAAVIAFANTEGGDLYLGVADDGTVLGIENADKEALRAINAIRDAVFPDVSMFVRCDTETIDGREVIHLSVKRGTNRPYYLAGKGPKPGGVFVRQGPSTVPASRDAIVDMISDSRGDSFEVQMSFNQNLTFEASKLFFQGMGKTLGIAEMKNYRMRLADGGYSNLGEFFSDQCQSRIRVAVFDGTDPGPLKEGFDAEGSVLKQFDAVFGFIRHTMPTRSEYEGYRRRDYLDFPLQAIREALLNMAVHRDYSMNADCRVNIFSDRMEFISPGGLPDRMTPEDLQNGLSVRRNPLIARVFEKLGMIEAMGLGLPLIRSAYKESTNQPIIRPAPNSFKLVLPKLVRKTERKTSSEWLCAVPEAGMSQMVPAEERILRFLRENGIAARVTLQAETGFSQPQLSRLLKGLSEKGFVIREGAGRNTRYRAV